MMKYKLLCRNRVLQVLVNTVDHLNYAESSRLHHYIPSIALQVEHPLAVFFSINFLNAHQFLPSDHNFKIMVGVELILHSNMSIQLLLTLVYSKLNLASSKDIASMI